MSPVSTVTQGFFQANYDKLILVVILGGLLGSALFLVLRVGQGKQQLVEAPWEKPAGKPKNVDQKNLEKISTQLDKLNNPTKVKPGDVDMMVSEVRVRSVNRQNILAPIPYDATICLFTRFPQPPIVAESDRDTDKDGMKDIFEKANRLDHLDPNDAYGDKDKDGFTNIEEHNEGTDLNDLEDYPLPHAKLRWYNIINKPFKLRFQGINEVEGVNIFLLNLRTLERSHFVKIGDEVEGFMVKAFLPDAAEGPTLMLERGEEQIFLVKGKEFNKFEREAYIVFLINHKRFKVKPDDEFTLKSRKYKIVDIKERDVLIHDLQTGKKTSVDRLTESEKEILMGQGSRHPRSEMRPGGRMPYNAMPGGMRRPVQGRPAEQSRSLPGGALRR